MHPCLQFTAGRSRWALLMAQLHSLLPSRQVQAQPWKYSMVLSSGKRDKIPVGRNSSCLSQLSMAELLSRSYHLALGIVKVWLYL